MLLDNIPPDCQERLAERIAVDSICEHLMRFVKAPLIEFIAQLIADEVREQEREKYFDALYKALAKHEKKFAEMIRGIWEEERRIIIANLKKLRKAHISKGGDKVDQILYPQKEMEKKIAEEIRPIIVLVMAEMGQKELQRLGLDVAFDVTNPEVVKWLKRYAFKFSKKLETVSIEKLRRILIEGMEAGKTIPELMKSVNETYETWDKIRAERIARTESIRSSNRGALEAYRQSGVVKKKVWVTNPGACSWCAPLDGKVIGLEKNFYNIGDSLAMEVDGKTQHLYLDYEDVEAPPLHVQCRCSIAAYFE